MRGKDATPQPAAVETCRYCLVPMVPGEAIVPPRDVLYDTKVIPATIGGCLKCPQCGHSVELSTPVR